LTGFWTFFHSVFHLVSKTFLFFNNIRQLHTFLRNGRRVPAPDGGAPSAAARLGRNGGTPV
jgi:hypothetical protein